MTIEARCHLLGKFIRDLIHDRKFYWELGLRANSA